MLKPTICEKDHHHWAVYYDTYYDTECTTDWSAGHSP